MSKRIHLICNAHLDPVWQWEWEEGAAETLSTFRIAAKFCEEYDQFVFCHNEALLYRWIEEYDMPLFREIQKLVKEGKWRIMGGWYLQPDCNMPCGEALVRQISEGRKYFWEKFGVKPDVAMNVDSFGHSRGLVQIMKQFGYRGYLAVRPQEHLLKLPANEFRWIGYDGSEITAIRADAYNTPKGRATEKIQSFIDRCPEGDSMICLWGIGNHGGGPSKEDIEKIADLTEKCAPEGVELLQSAPEDYLAELSKKELPAFSESLVPSMVGCYSSQVRLKQKYRQTENTYFMTEMMASHAHMAGTMDYPAEELVQAIYDILLVQFHDILPGSSVQSAEEMGLRVLDHALEILARVKARAFFALSHGQKPARPDRIPIFAYNPYPYPIRGDFFCEFMLWDQDWESPFLECAVYDEKDQRLPSQSEKENSNLPIQWRKRATFYAELAPMSMSRFDCAFIRKEEKPVYTMPEDGDCYVFEQDGIRIQINRKTGLVDEYSRDGVQYVKPGAFSLEVYEDNYDPWYMEHNSWEKKLGSFQLADDAEAQRFCGVKEPIKAVHIIEDGAVRTVAEAIFVYNSARAVVRYVMSRHEGLKIHVRLVWDEKQKLVRMRIPSAFGADTCIGQQIFGEEVLKDDMTENVSQEYLALTSEQYAILAINQGIYSSAFDKKESELKLTLMRSPAYCTHPLPDRMPLPQDRYTAHIDQGERDFEFLFEIGEKEEILKNASRTAQHFNMRPMLLSFYPDPAGERPIAPVELTGNVQFTALKQSDDGKGYIVRLFNPTDKAQTAQLRVLSAEQSVSFIGYELKTLRYQDGNLAECSISED